MGEKSGERLGERLGEKVHEGSDKRLSKMSHVRSGERLDSILG